MNTNQTNNYATGTTGNYVPPSTTADNEYFRRLKEMSDKQKETAYPNCGYCPYCGRGGYRTYPYNPSYPNYPTYPYPYWYPWGTSNIIWQIDPNGTTC